MNYQFIHTRNSLSLFLLIVLHFKINSFTTSSNVLWIRISNPRPSYPNKKEKKDREREKKRGRKERLSTRNESFNAPPRAAGRRVSKNRAGARVNPALPARPSKAKTKVEESAATMTIPRVCCAAKLEEGASNSHWWESGNTA